MNRKQRRAAGLAGPGASPRPHETAALLATGMRQLQTGQLAAAETSFRQLLARAPGRADALHLLGVALQDQGKRAEAIAAYRRALDRDPALADVWSDLGHALLQEGTPEAAVPAYAQAVALRPDDPTTHANLGVALTACARFDEAEATYGRALALDPTAAEVRSNLGNVWRARGQAEAAADAYRQAIALKPGFAEAHANLGAVLQDMGCLAEAEAACRRAAALAPAYADAHANLGAVLHAQGRAREAVAALRRAIALNPAQALAQSNLGNALRDLGRLTEAEAAYRQSLALRPGDAAVWSNLGNALQDQGRLDTAIGAYRRALELEPGYAVARSNLLMALHYTPEPTRAELFAEARRFGEAWAKLAAGTVHANLPNPERRLRIGYVSADFRNHPVGYFLGRALAAHDHAAFEIVCYAAHPAEDAMTARLREGADLWRSIAGLADEAAAALVRQDGIDVLVDLAGHTANNRLGLFARRPAPVQVSWLGYFDTTGLTAMDYVLADDLVAPGAEDGFFTEKVWRLPGCYLCYAPHAIEVAPAPPPALSDGAATFGCFNNRAKITQHTVRLWAEILRAVDGARLFLKSKSLGDAPVADALRAAFAAEGVDAGRLILEGQSPLAEMLAAYRRVDIALDPFPFGGGTTTAEALWMGVPLVSLRGDRWVGRMSASMLQAVGMPELVAADEREYVAKAVALAGDLPRLAALHRDLRGMVEDSRFCDGPGFARGLEAAYRGMWRAWCAWVNPSAG